MFNKDRWNEILEALNANRFRTMLTAFGVFWGIFILIFFLLYLNGSSGLILNFILSKTPSLQAILIERELSDMTLGLTLFFKLFIAWLPSYVLKDYDNNQFVNLSINISVISAFLGLLLIDIIVLNRIIEYLCIFQLVAISVMIKKLLAVRKFNLSSLVPVVCVFVLMAHHSRNVDSYYNEYNYQSIFSSNFRNNIFYKRHHRWESENFDNDYKVFRGSKIQISD